ncbi:MAG: peptidase [Alphaproteobacteria bacterium]|nr:peptidase [Alphaproteobacteria bacterium]
MTYCVGVLLDQGLVMASDTRTNAGVDNVASFRKMTIFNVPGKRNIVLLSAGNLAITQTAVAVIDEWRHGKNAKLNIDKAPSMFRVAGIIGKALREVYHQDADYLKKHNAEFNATFLLGGQIKGERPRLFQIYGAGNFIEAQAETPFLQIGEIKYGKPVFDRLLTMAMPMDEAGKLILISFDSTMRSNISVGLPIDLLILRKDNFKKPEIRRIGEKDPYFADLRARWGSALRKTFESLPPLPLES